MSGEASPAVVLDANENPLGPSPRAVEAMGLAASVAHRYPDDTGRALEAAIARAHGVEPRQVVVGPGATALIELLLRAHVAPGDEVVTARPTFVAWGLATRALGGTLVEVPEKDGVHDLEAMRAAIGPRTRVVAVVNPNNPTGGIVRRAAWRAFLASLPEGVVVASDEAYHEYVDDAGFPRTLEDFAAARSLVVLRTFSKVHGLAGARVGYALFADAAGAEAVGRRVLPFSVSAIARAGALAALDDHAHVARSVAAGRAGRAFLARGLAARGLRVLPSQANFVAVDLGRPAAAVCAALAARGVRVRDLGPWGAGDTWVRITAGTAAENARLLEALGAALDGAPARVA